MKYTVIVPVFNGEDTIGECIKSLLDQKGVTYGKDYSILVVDDGSTDGTQEIVRSFPVGLIDLPENQGRIVARLTGARRAETDRILFVDSRVNLPDDTIGKLDGFDGHPAVIGEMDPVETKYESAIHTILYLIRRRYYGKEFFPIADDLLIIQQNFSRAPKGTAVLLIDRDLFIKLTPERTGKDVNDDTLLFHGLIFDHKIGLLRSMETIFPVLSENQSETVLKLAFSPRSSIFRFLSSARRLLPYPFPDVCSSSGGAFIVGFY